MREIVLDTETTGFDPESGDRIVEIGAVELMGHVATGNTYHQYINPERSMPAEAFEVHGLGDEFLREKPKFAQIGQDFLDFMGIYDRSPALHGALLDSEILADVYLELIGGRQPDFGLSTKPEKKEGDSTPDWTPKPRPTPLPSRITPQEAAAHTEFVDKLGDSAVWKTL